MCRECQAANAASCDHRSRVAGEARTRLGEVISEAATLRDDLDEREATAEDHERSDRLIAEALDLRETLDAERTRTQAAFVAGMRAEYQDVADWMARSGTSGGLVDPPDLTGAREADREPLLWIYEQARELHEGNTASATRTVDLSAARINRMLINAGISAGELAVHAQMGTLGEFVSAARGPLGSGRDDQNRELSHAALSTSVLTPTVFSTLFYDYMESLPGLRSAGAFVTPLTRGNTITFYANRGHSDATGATTEGAAAAETNDSYGEYTISTAMYTGMGYMSRQLVEDAGPAGVVGIVENDLARVITRKSETAYHVAAFAYDKDNTGDSYARTFGANTTKGDDKLPTGLDLVKALVGLLYSLDPAYIQGRADWLAPSDVLMRIRLANISNIGFPYMPMGGDSRFALRPEGHTAQFDVFFQPETAIPAAAGAGADGGIPRIAIGNWRDAFHIADVGGVMLDMSREYRFAQQQVTLLGSLRTGGAIRDPRAAKLWCAKTKS